MSLSRWWTMRSVSLPSRATRELLALYARAGRGESNLGVFLREHPELLARIGVSLELSQDDAALALALAPAIGRFKKSAAGVNGAERCARAEQAAGQLAATARHESDRAVLDVGLLFGDVLAGTHEYIGLELETARISVRRHVLVRARRALRGIADLAAFVDERGLHITWRSGRGGLNLLPQREERGAAVLPIDLRARRPVRRAQAVPVRLGDVLAELGLM